MADRNFVVNGAPKFFFSDENIDRLFAMVMALGAEISAVGEKLDTMIRLIEMQQPVTQASVAGFEPDEKTRIEREAALRMLVGTMLAPFQDAANELAARARKAD